MYIYSCAQCQLGKTKKWRTHLCARRNFYLFILLRKAKDKTFGHLLLQTTKKTGAHKCQCAVTFVVAVYEVLDEFADVVEVSGNDHRKLQHHENHHQHNDNPHQNFQKYLHTAFPPSGCLGQEPLKPNVFQILAQITQQFPQTGIASHNGNDK